MKLELSEYTLIRCRKERYFEDLTKKRKIKPKESRKRANQVTESINRT